MHQVDGFMLRDKRFIDPLLCKKRTQTLSAPNGKSAIGASSSGGASFALGEFGKNPLLEVVLDGSLPFDHFTGNVAAQASREKFVIEVGIKEADVIPFVLGDAFPLEIEIEKEKMDSIESLIGLVEIATCLNAFHGRPYIHNCSF